MVCLLCRAFAQKDTGSPNKAYMDKMQQQFSSTTPSHGSLSNCCNKAPPLQELLGLHDKFQQAFTATLELKVIHL